MYFFLSYSCLSVLFFFFFFNDTATTEIYTLSLHDALPILHGRLNIPEVQARLRAHSSFPLVSISNAQRVPVPEANWVGTIYHGIPDRGIAPRAGGDYLVFLGRISPEKRPDLAIEIARRARLPIKIAAKVDQVDQAYFDTTIRPLLALPGVDFLGELDDAEKSELLAGAKA